MKSSSLAQRLEEFEAINLRLTSAPVTRRIVIEGVPTMAQLRAPRRRIRAGGIQVRDQGLRMFRVR